MALQSLRAPTVDSYLEINGIFYNPGLLHNYNEFDLISSSNKKEEVFHNLAIKSFITVACSKIITDFDLKQCKFDKERRMVCINIELIIILPNTVKRGRKSNNSQANYQAIKEKVIIYCHKNVC